MLKGRRVIGTHHGSLQDGRTGSENGSLRVLHFGPDEPLHGPVDAEVVRWQDEPQVQDWALVRADVPRCAHPNLG